MDTQKTHKDLIGYEGLYTITQEGDIYRIKSGTYLKPHLNKAGLYIMSLYNHKKEFASVSLAKLIYKNFVNPNIGKNDIVHFRDGNKQNLKLDNLYIKTRGRNCELIHLSNPIDKIIENVDCTNYAYWLLFNNYLI